MKILIVTKVKIYIISTKTKSIIEVAKMKDIQYHYNGLNSE